MSLNLTPTSPGVSAVSPPRITVIGVGGGGVNAVNNMITGQLRGVNFIAANTDAQQLALSKAETKLQLGPTLTRGLGAGAKPEVGRQSAEEVEEEIRQHLEGVDLVFVTAGMGGGTGTGAAPVVARIAREVGALTIGVVSKPFDFEGSRRSRAAAAGIAELEKYVDTLLVIPNQNLFASASQTTTLLEAFAMADDVLYSGIRSVTDLMVETGYQNLDFADVRSVMSGMGKAMMGIGIASAEEDGEDWAITAAERAISNPLLEEGSIAGARALLVNVVMGTDINLLAYDQVMNLIRETANCDDGEINSGFAFKDEMIGKVQVSVIATGLDNHTRHNVSDNIAAEKQQQIPPVRENPIPRPVAPEETSVAQENETPEQDGQPSPEEEAPVHEAPQPEAAADSTPPLPNYDPHLGPHQPAGTAPEPVRPREEPAQTGGGLFSRFFRSRPAADQERRDPPPPAGQKSPQRDHASPLAEDDDLNIPTYLRRGPK